MSSWAAWDNQKGFPDQRPTIPKQREMFAYFTELEQNKTTPRSLTDLKEKVCFLLFLPLPVAKLLSQNKQTKNHDWFYFFTDIKSQGDHKIQNF